MTDSSFFPNMDAQKAPNKEEQNWAVIMHLSCLAGYIVPIGGFLVPIVIWAIKREESKYLDEVGKEVLNFLITFVLLSLLSTALVIILVGLFLLWLLALWGVALPVIAAVKTSQGQKFRYPFILRFLK